MDILLDSNNTNKAKKWLLDSFNEDKLENVQLCYLEKLYHDILYGKFGVWNKEEVS